MKLSKDSQIKLLVCVGLAVVTLAVYWPLWNQEFVNYDDPDLVTSNVHVQRGITGQSVIWAFTTGHTGNWLPLTWLSHMLDCRLFGLHAGAHKMVNVAFHIGSTVLLFLVLNQMTAAPWRSGFVAAAFALHPLRVESVAWVSERKDVLSAFFWMLTMWMYVRYVEHPQARRYVPVLLCFALGLMSKSMLVTMPFVLLLLDLWPLKRLPLDRTPAARRRVLNLVREKLPLFVLSAASCVMTYRAQATASAIKSIPSAYRVANAVVSYLRYICKTVWPANLAVFYPQFRSLAFTRVALAAAAIITTTVLMVRVVRNRPYLTVGWFWYLGILFPVIGLIQVGDQSMADRFTYIPSIGILIMVTWGLAELFPHEKRFQTALRVVAIGTLVFWTGVTSHQIRFWTDSTTLFERAIAVTHDNYVAQNNLGVALRGKGRSADAAKHFSEAIRIWPEFPEAHKNLADILAHEGRLHEAIDHYSQAVRTKPNWAEAHNNFGFALAAQGSLDEAAAQFQEAVRLEPESALDHCNLGLAFVKLGKTSDALAQLSQALALNPEDPQAQYLMGVVLKDLGRPAEAVQYFTGALRLNPNLTEARVALQKTSQ